MAMVIQGSTRFFLAVLLWKASILLANPTFKPSPPTRPEPDPSNFDNVTLGGLHFVNKVNMARFGTID